MPSFWSFPSKVRCHPHLLTTVLGMRLEDHRHVLPACNGCQRRTRADEALLIAVSLPGSYFSFLTTHNADGIHQCDGAQWPRAPMQCPPALILPMSLQMDVCQAYGLPRKAATALTSQAACHLPVKANHHPAWHGLSSKSTAQIMAKRLPE